jgi:hypothetical protein
MPNRRFGRGVSPGLSRNGTSVRPGSLDSTVGSRQLWLCGSIVTPVIAGRPAVIWLAWTS